MWYFFFFFFFSRMSGKESRADLSRRRRAVVVYVGVTGAWCSSGQKSWPTFPSIGYCCVLYFSFFFLIIFFFYPHFVFMYFFFFIFVNLSSLFQLSSFTRRLSRLEDTRLRINTKQWHWVCCATRLVDVTTWVGVWTKSVKILNFCQPPSFVI